jgi:hypothetical protein
MTCPARESAAGRPQALPGPRQPPDNPGDAPGELVSNHG